METVLLLGDSLVEYGDWEILLPDYRTINRGFAGETAGGLAGRLVSELNNQDDPDRIVILSGTNDLLMGDYSFPAVFETMLPLLRQFCPQTEIIVVGLAPLQMVLNSVEEMNELLENITLESGCRFLDLSPTFHLKCRPVGNPCFLMDGVHFSPHGYRVLARAIDDVLKTRL
jgi:lysophospholipase L1-like esterase